MDKPAIAEDPSLGIDYPSATQKTCIYVDGLDEYESDNAARSDLVERELLEVTTHPRDHANFQKRVDVLHRTARDIFESGAFDDML